MVVVLDQLSGTVGYIYDTLSFFTIIYKRQNEDFLNLFFKIILNRNLFTNPYEQILQNYQNYMQYLVNYYMLYMQL